MPLRQRFVVQLGITEVQWNQGLLDFYRISPVLACPKNRRFAA
jgi:hypothetical protein